MPDILLVEDFVDLCNMVKEGLSREGYTVETANNGRIAQQLIDSREFDLLILDWDLPEITGIDICKHYRAQGGMTPILMLTGKKGISDKEAGFDAGADDYLTKPFHPKELFSRVKALLRRIPLTPPDQAATIPFGSNHVGINQFESNQVGINQFESNQVGSNQARSNQDGSNLIGSNKVAGELFDTSQFGTIDSGTSQSGTSRSGTSQPGTSQTASNQPGTNQSNPFVVSASNRRETAGAAAKTSKFGVGEIENYELLSMLGEGNVGVVYRGKHKYLERVVAIKMLKQQRLQDSTSLSRFRQEAKAVSSLSHPNIITIYDFGVTTNGLPYLAMDYLPGQSLSDMLEQEKRLAPERCAKIFSQVMAALQHAHAKGVVHRDIKPSNMMFCLAAPDESAEDSSGSAETEAIKIVDFGIAKILDQNLDQKLTRTGEIFGSPLYMSPEQCLGQKLDARSDIFSLGCVMYETLTGIAPFMGTSVMDTIFRRTYENPPVIDPFPAHLAVPPAFQELVLKMLARNPEDRYSSMAAAKSDLDRVFA